MTGEMVELPALPEESPPKLRLDRDRAIAALVIARKITIADAAAALDSVMRRVHGTLERAIAETEAEHGRSPEVQAQATAERERWQNVHGQTVAGSSGGPPIER